MIKLLPYKAGQWVECPGSAALEERYPEPPGPKSQAQLEGNTADWLAHRVVASWWSSNSGDERYKRRTAASFIGDTAPKGVEVTAEMAEHIQGYVDLLRETAGDLDHVEIEKPMAVAHNMAAGRADAFFHHKEARWLHIWDLKYGRSPVAAVGNWQLVRYALSALAYGVNGLSLYIYQPRGPGNTIKPWHLTVDQLMPWIDRMIERADIAQGSEPWLRAGSHCKHCTARHGCEALRLAAGAATVYAGLPTDMDPDGDALAADLHTGQAAKELIEARLSGGLVTAEHRLKTGTPVPGWTMAPSWGHKAWRRPEAAQSMADLHGVDITDTNYCTPAEAVRRGLSQEVVDSLSVRPSRAPKLKKQSPEDIARIFENGR